MRLCVSRRPYGAGSKDLREYIKLRFGKGISDTDEVEH